MLNAALNLDVTRDRIIRALVTARSLSHPDTRPRTLRIASMTEPLLGLLRPAECPGTDVVLTDL